MELSKQGLRELKEEVRELLRLVPSGYHDGDVYSAELVEGRVEGTCWELVGSGHFSHVFAHSYFPGFVVKVRVRPGDSYPIYALWCKQNQQRGVPVIHAVVGRRAFVLDELQPSGSHDSPAEVAYFLSHAEHGCFDVYLPDGLEYLRPLMQEIYDRLGDVCALDLHRENWMVDRDGDVVITDPVSFSHTYGL